MQQNFSHFKPPSGRRISYEDRPSRWWLFWHNQKKHLKKLLLFPLFIALSAGGGWASFTFFPQNIKEKILQDITPFNPFIIHHIYIDGNMLTDEKSVYLALGKVIDTNFFNFSIEEARKNIMDLPFVAQCTIKRIWPNGLKIHLIERKPIAIWQNKGHFNLINAQGEIISSHEISVEKEGHIFRKLPLIVGEDANKTANLLIETIHSYPKLEERISALMRVGQRRWNIILKNKTVIMLPEGAEKSALAHLETYEEAFQLLDRPIPSIDMRLPDRMTVHLLPPSDDPLPSLSSSSHH